MNYYTILRTIFVHHINHEYHLQLDERPKTSKQRTVTCVSFWIYTRSINDYELFMIYLHNQTSNVFFVSSFKQKAILYAFREKGVLFFLNSKRLFLILQQDCNKSCVFIYLY
jgi:hypothetical protein